MPHQGSVDLVSPINVNLKFEPSSEEKVEDQPFIIHTPTELESDAAFAPSLSSQTPNNAEKNTDFRFKFAEQEPLDVEYQQSSINLEDVLVENAVETPATEVHAQAPGLVLEDKTQKTPQPFHKQEQLEKQAQRKQELEQLFTKPSPQNVRLNASSKPKIEKFIAAAMTTTLKRDQGLFSNRWWMLVLLTLLMMLGFGYFALFVYSNFSADLDRKMHSFNPATLSSERHTTSTQLVLDTVEKKALEATPDVQSSEFKQQDENVTQVLDYQQPPVADDMSLALEKQATIQRKPVVLQQSTKKTPIELAYEFYLSGDFKNAERHYRQALRDNPESKLGLIGLAAVAAAREDYQQAMSFYQRVLELNADDADALQGIASISAGLGDAIILQQDLLQLVRRYPDSAVLQFSLGNNYVQRADWFKAQQHYFESVRLEPKNADYRLNLAISLDHLGDYKSALEQYKMSLALKDQTQGSWFDVRAVQQRINDLNRHLSGGL